MDRFSRFLFSRCGHLSKDQKRVTARAFIPPSDGKLSVLGEDGLQINRIWEIGKCVEKMRQPQTLLGRGGFDHSTLLKLGLNAEPEDSDCFDHGEHWHLTGWHIADRA